MNGSTNVHTINRLNQLINRSIAHTNARINAYITNQLNAYTINQLNDCIIAHTIVSTNVSTVNRPCKRLHVALYKALHETLPKLY